MNSEEAQAKITRTLRANGFKMTGDIWELEECGRVMETRNAERAVIVEMDLPDGLKLSLSRFRKNPVVLYEHDYDRLPIGRSLWERLFAQEGRDSWTLRAKVQFHLETEPSRTVWDRVFAGELRHFAPGVIPTAILETGGCARVLTADLIEYSIMEASTEPSSFASTLLREDLPDPNPHVGQLAKIEAKDWRIADLRSASRDLKALIAEIHGALKNTTDHIECRLRELDT